MRTSRPWKLALSPSLKTRPVPATTVPLMVACIHDSPPFIVTTITAVVYATVTVRVSVTVAPAAFFATIVNVHGPAGVVKCASNRPPGLVTGAPKPLTVTVGASVVPLTTTTAFSIRAPFVGESRASLIGAAVPAVCP